MKILDLFAGVGGERRRARIEARGHLYHTLDIDPRFDCTFTKSIFDVRPEELAHYDFVWASVPCECFSVAAIPHNWTGGIGAYVPLRRQTRAALDLVEHTVKLLCSPLVRAKWVIENPRGLLRKMPVVADLPRETITLCRYAEPGDALADICMKPTDLWGDFPPLWKPRPMCHNGNPDHAAAPRGSRTGTQGKSNAAERAVIPWLVWSDFLDALEK